MGRLQASTPRRKQNLSVGLGSAVHKARGNYLLAMPVLKRTIRAHETTRHANA
jgi:hypothetical protein